MKRLFISLVVASFLATASLPLMGQAPTSTASNDATTLLAAISKAAWGGTAATSIQLSGNATWQAGSEVEQGTVTVSADDSGNSSLQISGGINRVETETAIGPGRLCQWSGDDGQLHTVDSINCAKPIEWLLPALTLQPGLTPASAGFVDLGISAFSSGKLRHLQAQLVLPGLPTKAEAEWMRRSTMDVGVDPATFLPTVLTYHVHPDNGAPVKVAIEIRYSDYHKIGNAEIPFHIQRYISGALQLDLQITSATLS